MNPPPPNNNDNDNEDAAAATAIIPAFVDGNDDDDDEDSEENNNEDADNFGPPVLPEDHSDVEEEEDDEEEIDEEEEGDDDDNDDEDEDNGDEDEDADTDDDFIDDPVEQTRICKEAIVILLNRLNFPSPQRDRAIVRFAQQFITNVKEDIHAMLTDTRTVDEGYDGLDRERDTEAEVETAIRCGPEVLTRREERFGWYPIQCVSCMYGDDNQKYICNVKAVSFVHLFARLAIEFHSFDETERGGLLVEDVDGNNVLHDLTYSSDPSHDKEHHERVDASYLAVLVRLRHANLFTEDDIQQYKLVVKLCQHRVFANQRFRFMTEWCPSSLLQIEDEDGSLPLHWATTAIESFRPVCDAVFHCYPKWRGMLLLHQRNTLQETTLPQTPFQAASEHIGHIAALTIVEETLARYSGTVLPDLPKVLFLAASEEQIHVACVYFLLKRQPVASMSILQQRYGRPPGPVV